MVAALSGTKDSLVPNHPVFTVTQLGCPVSLSVYTWPTWPISLPSVPMTTLSSRAWRACVEGSVVVMVLLEFVCPRSVDRERPSAVRVAWPAPLLDQLAHPDGDSALPRRVKSRAFADAV